MDARNLHLITLNKSIFLLLSLLCLAYGKEENPSLLVSQLISMFTMLTAVGFVFMWGEKTAQRKQRGETSQSYNNKWDTKQRLKQETKCYSSAWSQTEKQHFALSSPLPPFSICCLVRLSSFGHLTRPDVFYVLKPQNGRRMKFCF